MERYWAFAHPEYEAGTGMDDLVGTYRKKEDAIKQAETDEWGAVFDVVTNTQASHQWKDWTPFEKIIL